MGGPSFDPTETTGQYLVDPPRQTRQIVSHGYIYESNNAVGRKADIDLDLEWS